MAKTQVTEEDIAQGIQGLGGFGNLAQKPRRDSPFGSDFAQKKPEPKLPTPPAPVAAVAAPAQIRTMAANEPVVASQPLAKKVETVVPLKDEITPQIQRAVTPKVAAPKKEQVAEVTAVEGQGSAEDFTERITLQMTAEMRDTLNGIARTLQRGRRDKGGRITANTLMRVAIQSFIDGYDQKALSGVSSEEELLREVQTKRKSRA